MRELYDMPGHLIRRFQQIAVAVFHAEVGKLGSDLTPVQYAALVTVIGTPGIGQTALAGMIAYDRTTIGGVVDRLVQKGFLDREVSSKDRRAHVLRPTEAGRDAARTIEPAVLAAQDVMLGGLEPGEAKDLMRLMHKAIAAGNEMSRAPLVTEATGIGG